VTSPANCKYNQIRVGVKVKSFLTLITDQAMKTYGGTEV